MKAQKPWTWPHFHLSSETLVEWTVCWEVLLLSPPGPPESSPAVWDVSQTRWSSLWFDWDWVEPLVCPHWAFSWVMRKQLVHFEESFGGCLGPLVVYVPRHCSKWHWVSWNVCEGGNSPWQQMPEFLHWAHPKLPVPTEYVTLLKNQHGHLETIHLQ